MTAIRIIDDHTELASIGTNSHADLDTHVAAANDYVKRDGSLPLTADWDIGNGIKILADHIRARDGDGLKLCDDGGNGIFVKDGGKVGIGTLNPLTTLHVQGKISTGNSITTASATRALNLVSSDAVMRIWRKSSVISSDASIEFITSNANIDTISCRWDMYLDKEFGNFVIREREYMGGSVLSDRLVIKGNTGNVGIGTIAPTALLDINSDILRLRTAKTPATAGSAGNQGDICWDANYIYVCTATNTWKRSALSSW